MNSSTILLKIPHKHNNKPTEIKHTLLLRHCFKSLTWMTILKTTLQEDQEMSPQSHNWCLERDMWRGFMLHVPKLFAQFRHTLTPAFLPRVWNFDTGQADGACETSPSKNSRLCISSELKGGMITTGGVLCPQGGKPRCWLGDLPFLSQLLCGGPSGKTEVIFTFLLTSDLAHPLNRPNRIPQIPPCPVPIRFPSLPLPASLSLFFPSGAWGGKFKHFWNMWKSWRQQRQRKTAEVLRWWFSG